MRHQREGRDVIRPLGALAQVVAVSITALSLCAAPFMRSVLPDRFLLDDGHIRELIKSPIPEGGGSPFDFTADFYKSIDLGSQPEVAAFVLVALFAIAAWLGAGWSDLRRFNLLGSIALGVAYLGALAYMAQYSKEFFTLLVVLIVLILPKNLFGEIMVVVVGAGYGLLIRPYWGVIVILYVVWRIVLPRIKSVWLFLLVVLGCYIALWIGFQFVLGDGLLSARTGVNVSRDVTDTASLIVDPLPTTGVLAPLDALVMFIFLLVPIPLLLLGSPFHAFFALVIVAIWAAGFYGYISLERNAAHDIGRHRHGATGPDAKILGMGRRAACLILSLVMVQAIFEPDFGSYIKHLTPVFPLFLTLMPRVRMPDAWVESDSSVPAGQKGEAEAARSSSQTPELLKESRS